MFHSDATLTFPQTIVLRYSQLEPPERRLPQAVEDYSKWYLARLKRVNSHLLDREYLCDDRFTIADIAVGPTRCIWVRDWAWIRSTSLRLRLTLSA